MENSESLLFSWTYVCLYIQLLHLFICNLTEYMYRSFNSETFMNLICIFRVVYIFGNPIKFPLEDITPTYLTEGVLSTLRQADYVTTKVLQDSKCIHKLSQMPVVIVPLHFDRDPTQHLPSCQRSVVIRTFLTHDFMTGIAAQPDKHLPVTVSMVFSSSVLKKKCSYYDCCVAIVAVVVIVQKL